MHASGGLAQVRSQAPDDDWLGLVSGGRYAASLAGTMSRTIARLRTSAEATS